MPYKLSPSSINLFLECPRCFWLQLVKGIKRPEGIFPSLPSGMDKILKEHFDAYAEKGLLPPEISAHGLKNGYQLFSDKKTLNVWRSNFKGITYVDKTSGVLLRGAVDNILTNGKKLIVLDYKTRGFPLKEDTHTHYQTQMDIYNFLLRKNGYETENYAYLLFYHPEKVNEKGDVIFHTDFIRIETDTKHGEKVFLDAVRCLDGGEPGASENCDYCKWQKSK